MKHVLVAMAFGLVAQVAAANAIDPATTEFQWMNGPTSDARYKMSENADKVHVFEAYSLSCSWCNRNATQVATLAAELGNGVQFLDLGLDSADRDYQRWIAAHNPPYPVVKDAGRTVWNALMQENGIPQTFVVGCDGSLVGYTIGYWGAAEKQAIRDAVATAKATTCN